MPWVDDVLHLWFDELGPRDWWHASATTDATIERRHGTLFAAMRRAPPDPEALDARGHVAAVIVFDQFPRHLFRSSERAFATDPFALSITERAIVAGLDVDLPRRERHFLYMPLMHAEDLEVQQRAVERFATLDDPDALRSALQHRDTIARFGRFPRRNAALGRVDSDDETAYLARCFRAGRS